MLVLLLALAASPAHAQEIRPHSLAVGFGHHYGWYGIAYTHRWKSWGFQAGAGWAGVAVQGRFHPTPWRALYLGAGVSPLLRSEFFGPRYGPDLSVGAESGTERIHALAEIGLGVASVPLAGTQTVVTFGVGVGVNLGARRPVVVDNDDE